MLGCSSLSQPPTQPSLHPIFTRAEGCLHCYNGERRLLPALLERLGYCFKPQSIKKSFEATGIYPPNPEVVLKRFRKEASDSDESSSSIFEGDKWIKMESVLRRTVKDQSSKDVKKVLRSLHHISAQNIILHAENRGLRESLAVKKRQHKKSYTLQLNNPGEYHGGAVFWSPKKVRQARDDEIVRP